MQFQYPSSTPEPTSSTDSMTLSTGEQQPTTPRTDSTLSTGQQTTTPRTDSALSTGQQLTTGTSEQPVEITTPLSVHSVGPRDETTISTGEPYERTPTCSPGKIPTVIIDTDSNESKKNDLNFIIVIVVLTLIITMLIVLLIRQYIKNKKKRMYVPPRQSLLESSDSYMIPMSGIPMTSVGISKEEEEGEDVIYESVSSLGQQS